MLDISAFEAVTHDKKPPGLTASAPDCCAEPPFACDAFPGSKSSRNAFCKNATLHARQHAQILLSACDGGKLGLQKGMQALQQTKVYSNPNEL